MKLNADVGEGVGDDESLFRWIEMANVACGAHAGGPEEMAEAVDLAMSYGVSVGAHPGYPDREGFGRKSMEFSSGELTGLVIEQVEASIPFASGQEPSCSMSNPTGHSIMI